MLHAWFALSNTRDYEGGGGRTHEGGEQEKRQEQGVRHVAKLHRGTPRGDFHETEHVVCPQDWDGRAADSGLPPREPLVGQDEKRGDELRAIEFERIAGGKAFDVSVSWFTDLLRDLGQA